MKSTHCELINAKKTVSIKLPGTEKTTRWHTVYPIGGGVWASTILVGIDWMGHLLLSLLSLLLALFLFHHLLALDGHEYLVGFDVFGIIRVDTLLLHLLEFLRQG